MKKLGCLLLAAIIAQGCDAFKTGGAVTTPGSTTNNSASGGGGDSTNNDITQVDMKSTVDSGANAGALALDMDIQNGNLILRVPLAASSMIGMPLFGAQIPQIPGASIQTVIDANGRNAVVITIPMSKFLKGIALGTPGKLPNGDQLPAVPRGELPTVALNIDINHNTKLYLYIGVDQAAAFVETPHFDPFKMIPGLPIVVDKVIFPVKNKNKQLLGYFGYIGSKFNFPGGFYLATSLPPAIIQILDNYFIH